MVLLLSCAVCDVTHLIVAHMYVCTYVRNCVEENQPLPASIGA